LFWLCIDPKYSSLFSLPIFVHNSDEINHFLRAILATKRLLSNADALWGFHGRLKTLSQMEIVNKKFPNVTMTCRICGILAAKRRKTTEKFSFWVNRGP
jgi:hypothetical protein